MPTYTIDLTAATQNFEFGIQAPWESKDWDATSDYKGNANAYGANIAYLPLAERMRFCGDILPQLSLMSTFVCGLGSAVEDTDNDRFHQSPRQRQLSIECAKAMGSRANLLVTPISAPSSVINSGYSTTLRPNGTDLPVASSAGTINAAQAFLVTTGNWQIWLEAIAAEMTDLQAQGWKLKYFTTPNESSVGAVANHWQTYLTWANHATFIRRIWLGESQTGGGIKDRFPGLQLIVRESLDNTGVRAAVRADATALAEVTYFDVHEYNATGLANLGCTGGDADDYGITATTEMGMLLSGRSDTQGGTSSTDSKNLFERIHDHIAYGRTPLCNFWPVMRDGIRMAVADTRGVTYSAKGLLDCRTATGKWSYTPNWWVVEPFLRAAGPDPCTSVVAAGRVTTDSVYTPTSGVRVAVFVRPNGTVGALIGNFSGSTVSSVVLTLTNGVASSLTSADITAYRQCIAGRDVTTNTAAVSSGSVTIGDIANNRIVLVELT